MLLPPKVKVGVCFTEAPIVALPPSRDVAATKSIDPVHCYLGRGRSIDTAGSEEEEEEGEEEHDLVHKSRPR